ncbi:MAG: cobalt-precorrin-5B (C(1))-methyltransferase CbiD [Synechococcaceae cyanobacterium]|nr:cobalt-precorrin-5B (C(1))-methyltransferase CbiD [Synechococcaceae cyanobacterium]
MPTPQTDGASGLTLPVWVAAAARAALGALLGEPFRPRQRLQLLEPQGEAEVPVGAAARLGEDWALAEAQCQPGDGLDLTRGLPVWVLARWRDRPAGTAPDDDGEWLALEAGEGVGRHAATGGICLSTYARRLLEANLRPSLPPGRGLRLRVVLPTGRALAERTSNAAFGVVDGLALIGTRAEARGSAGPDPLAASLRQVAERVAAPGFGGDLIVVIGANGLDLAPRLGLPEGLLVRAGNWLGPVLVAAAEQGVRRLLLFGYRGKLLKLAGGIFHTHHHLADGRTEVLTALAALEGLAGERLRALHAAPTVEAALTDLEREDPRLAERLQGRVAAAIEERSRAYLARHGQEATAVGAVLFDRARRVCCRGPVGGALFGALGGPA